MKINVEFDLTPQEFRQAMGLPDVEAFQSTLMSRIQEQMEAGAEGYDPMSLMQTFLKQPFFKEGMQPPLQESVAQGLASFGSYQQMMLDMLRQAASSTSNPAQEKSQPEAPEQDEAGAAKTKASATSRAKRK